MIIKSDFVGSPHIGIFCIANDSICLAPYNCPQSFEEKIKEHLQVDVVKIGMAKTGLLGIFSAMNNKMIVTSDILEKEEIKTLKDYLPEVLVLDIKFTAIGNLVAMNDKAIVASPFLKKKLKDSISLKVADSDLIGSSLFVNNKGFLAHRETTDDEVERLEKALKVKGGIGSVNLGDPYIKSGIVGNKYGLIVGSKTSGPELNRIDDIFILEDK